MVNWVWIAIVILAGSFGWHQGRPRSEAPLSVENAPRHGTLLTQRASTSKAAAPMLNAPISTIAERLSTAVERSETDSSFEVQLLIAQWFQHDRVALREWALKKSNHRLKNAIIRHWFHESPKTVWIIERHSSKDSWNKSVDTILAQDFPKRFFDIASEKRSRARQLLTLIPTAIEHLAHEDFARAESIVASLDDESKKHNATIGLSRAMLKRTNFDEAFAWASTLEHFSDSALATIIDSLAKTDLDKALGLLEAHVFTRPPHQSLINTHNATRKLTFEEGIAKRNQYDLPFHLPVKRPVLLSDPFETASILEAAGYDRPPSYWKPDTNEAALNAMASQAETPLNQALINQMIVSFHRTHPTTALEWINDRPTADERSRLAAHLVGSGTSKDHLPSLMNLIDHEQIRETDESLHHRILSAAKGAGQTMAAQDPEAAIRLVEQIENQHARTSAFRTIGKLWFRHDEQATIDWLRSLSPGDREATVNYSSTLREALSK